MAFSESSLYEHYVLVANAATTVDTGLTYSTARVTGVTLSPQQESTTSSEIVAGRTPPDAIRTNSSGTGDLNFELSAYDTVVGGDNEGLDQMMKAALAHDVSTDWQAAAAMGAAATDITLDKNTNQLIDNDANGTLFSGIEAGMTITLGTNFTNNAGSYVVAEAIDADTLVLIGSFTTSDSAVDGTGGQITREQYIKIGGTKYNCFHERVHQSTSGTATQFEYFVNTLCTSMSLSLAVNSIATGSFGFLGAIPTITGVGAPSRALAGSDYPATTTNVMNGMDQLLSLAVMNSTSAAPANFDQYAAVSSSWDFTLDNNARQDSAIGALGTVNTGLGIPSVTGNANIYLEDTGVLDVMIADTKKTMGAIMADSVSGGAAASGANNYGFGFDQVTYTNAQTPVSDGNSPTFAQLNWNARGLIISRWQTA